MKKIYTHKVNVDKLIQYLANEFKRMDSIYALKEYYTFLELCDELTEDEIVKSKTKYKSFINKYNKDIKQLQKDNPGKNYIIDKDGKPRWICSLYMGGKNAEEVMRKHYKLYHNIKINGIKENVSFIYSKDAKSLNEYIYEGWHRLTIAKFLNIEDIDVDFMSDNNKMIELCNLAFNVYSKNKFSVYQPIEHPFFDFIQVHSNSPIKFNRIKKTIEDNDLKNEIVDFGCLSGYYVRHLNEIGHKAIGVEYEQSFWRMAELVCELKGVQNKAIFGRVQDFIKRSKGKCDLIAMSFFHHWIKQEGLFKYFNNIMMPWIKKNVDVMYSDVADMDGETQMNGIYKQMTQKEYIDYLMENGGFKYIKYCPECAWQGRKTFILSKDELK